MSSKVKLSLACHTSFRHKPGQRNHFGQSQTYLYVCVANISSACQVIVQHRKISYKGQCLDVKAYCVLKGGSMSHDAGQAKKAPLL